MNIADSIASVLIGLSSLIISINSPTGFLFSIAPTAVIDWRLALSVAAIAIAGILASFYLSTKIKGKKLQPAFGWLVLIMGVYTSLKKL